MSIGEIRNDLDEELEEKVREVIEQTSESESEINTKLQKKFEEYKDHQTAALDDQDIRELAVHSVTNQYKNIFGSMRSLEELPILTMGFMYRKAEYFYTDEDAIIGLGIVNPEDDQAGVSVFLIRQEDGIDLGYAADLFKPLNTIVGTVERREVGSRSSEQSIRKGGSPTYTLQTGEESTFEMKNDFEKLPSEKEEKRELINDNFLCEAVDESERMGEVVDLQNYSSHFRAGNDNGFELCNGIDVKRFRGTVASTFDNGDHFGIVTMVDDTVFDDSDISDELLSEDQRTPGMSVVMDPSMIDFGEDSVLDVYGYVDQDGESEQYRFHAFGAVPIIKFARESSGEQDTVEEDML